VTVFKGFVLALAGLLAGSVSAQELNLYSSRHYQTDEALYTNFTKATGIKINRIEGGEDPLIERIRNEGERSPADVLITVDAGRLWRAEQMGLFQPVKAATLESRIRRTCASQAACGTASRRARASSPTTRRR